VNHNFLVELRKKYPGDEEKIKRMSLIEEGWDKKVRMAFLAIVCSHSVNGVAALHTDLLKKTIFSEFEILYPKKI
jgi:starch phosphorylase